MKATQTTQVRQLIVVTAAESGVLSKVVTGVLAFVAGTLVVAGTCALTFQAQATAPETVTQMPHT